VLLGVNHEAWWREAVLPWFAGEEGSAYPFVVPQALA
jgi:hypothetical protein